MHEPEFAGKVALTLIASLTSRLKVTDSVIERADGVVVAATISTASVTPARNNSISTKNCPVTSTPN